MTYTEPLILVFVLIALAGLVRRRRALATIGIPGVLFGRSCAIGVGTVHKYVKRAEASLGRCPRIGIKRRCRSPDFGVNHEQLRSSKYVTLQLLWEEYRQGTAIATRDSANCTSVGGPSSTWFCGKRTKPGKRCSWIGPARRFRFGIATPAFPGNRRCSWPRWGQFLDLRRGRARSADGVLVARARAHLCEFPVSMRDWG